MDDLTLGGPSDVVAIDLDYIISIQHDTGLHPLRCSPCVNHPCLEMFDNLLRKGIGTICHQDFTDLQWLL